MRIIVVLTASLPAFTARRIERAVVQPDDRGVSTVRAFVKG